MLSEDTSLYLYGRSFILLTDHNPLTSLRGLKDTGGRLTCWLLFLQQFDIAIKYRAGRSNGNADAMSRCKCEFKESARQAVFEDSNAMVGEITYLGDQGLLKQKQGNESFTKSILQSIREGRKLPLRTKRWSKYLVIDGVLCRQSRNGGTSRTQIVVPQELRSYILDELHSKSEHLHVGAFKTFQKIKEQFFWPGYEQEIHEAVQRCDLPTS